MKIRTVLAAFAVSWVAVSASSTGQTSDASKAKVPATEQAKTMTDQAKTMTDKATPAMGTATLRAVSTEGAPKAAGPYSQAVVAGGFLFAAGQVPRDPITSQLVTGGFEVSAERVLDNLEAVLKADGLTWFDVVKTTVYLTKAEDFAALNTVYGKRMGDAKPARTTVVVAGLPGGAALEIELIAKARR